MMFPFDQLGRAAHAVVREAEEAGTALVHTVQDAVSWSGDLFSGDVGVQAMPVPAVVDHVMAGDSTSWTESGLKTGDTAAAHHEIAADLTAMLNNLEPAWTGRGAASARQRTKAFSDLIERAGRTLSSNGSNVTDAAYGFELAKRSMEPMGDPPDKSFFDVASPWDTDTEDAISAYNAKARKNLEIYRAYVEHLDRQGQGLSGDYGWLAAETSTAEPADSQNGESHRVTGSGEERDTPQPLRERADTRTSDVPGIVDPGGDTGRSGEEDAHIPDPNRVVASQQNGTEAAGFTPSARVPDGQVLSGLEAMPPLGRGASSPASGSGGSPLLAVPYAPVPAPNPALRQGVTGGTGGSPRAGTGHPGAGARGGGGRPAGGRGAAGAPGVAPVGNGRASAEDEEHERKYVRDDDTVFADVEDGLVDPDTGFGPVSPTIGT